MVEELLIYYRLRSKMTVKAAEASGSTLTYSKMRGMVAILIGERQRGFFDHAQEAVIFLAVRLNDFISPVLLRYSFHEAEKNGAERLYSEDSHQLLCMQAVSIRSSARISVPAITMYYEI